MILSNWIRLDQRTLINTISGKLSAKEQDDFRRWDNQKGEYHFYFSPRTGKTTIRVIEHPEWM